MKERLVLIGNGMAGGRALEELHRLAPERYAITVFGAEPHGNYNRILLSPLLAGEKRFPEIILNDHDWYAERGITLHSGRRIVAIDRANRRVVADDGSETGYDRLLLATGSRPFILPVPGNDLDGVVGFRDLSDVERMTAAAERGGQAVVIGGGLLGLEAANGLRKRGMSVTVVHLNEILMERQLDAPAAALLQRALEAEGLHFLMGARTESILGGGRVGAVRFEGGLEISADLVVMAVGIQPEIELARAAGIECGRGVVVDDTLRASDPRIFAVGECAEHRGVAYGLVAPLYEQAKVAAAHLAGRDDRRYHGSRTSTKLKVTGIDLFSAGDFNGDETTETLRFQDHGRGVYKKLVIREDRLVGAVLYGDTVDGAWYFQLMRDGADVSALREHLIFGRAVAERRDEVADEPAMMRVA